MSHTDAQGRVDDGGKAETRVARIAEATGQDQNTWCWSCMARLACSSPTGGADQPHAHGPEGAMS